MSLDISRLDEQIERLREGNTLSEHEVNALCDKVSPNEHFGKKGATSARALGRAPRSVLAVAVVLSLVLVSFPLHSCIFIVIYCT